MVHAHLFGLLKVIFMRRLQTKNIPIETILNSEAEKDELRNEISVLEQRLNMKQSECKSAGEQSAKLEQVCSVQHCILTDILCERRATPQFLCQCSVDSYLRVVCPLCDRREFSLLVYSRLYYRDEDDRNICFELSLSRGQSSLLSAGN